MNPFAILTGLFTAYSFKRTSDNEASVQNVREVAQDIIDDVNALTASAPSVDVVALQTILMSVAGVVIAETARTKAMEKLIHQMSQKIENLNDRLKEMEDPG